MNYPYAIYATDMKFQRTFRPVGRFEEARRYFLDKLRLYGVKLEASITYLGICVHLSANQLSSTSDLTMFLNDKNIYLKMLKKLCIVQA